MKTIYLIALIMFASLLSFAQNKIAEVCYDIYAEPAEIVDLHADYYAILHKTSKNCEKHSFSIFTSDHEYMFTITAKSGEENAPTIMYASGPKNFRLYDYYVDGGNLKHTLMTSYNLEGNLRNEVDMYFSILDVLEKPVEEIQISHLDFESYIIDKDGNFYVSFFQGGFAGIGSAVLREYHGSEDLSNWEKFQFFDYEYFGFGSFATSKIHGFTNTSAYRFERFDYYEDGSYYLVTTFSSIDNVVQFTNKHYFLSSGNKIFHLNKHTDIIDSMAVSNYFEDIVLERVSNDILYRLSREGGAGNENKYVLQGFDPELMLMIEEYYFESDLEGVLLFNKDGDRLLLYGNIGLQATMEEFSLNSPPSAIDFGVNLVANSLEVIDFESLNEIEEGLNEMVIDLSIELTNFSSSTINEVDLIYFLEDSCETKVITKVGTNIPPGATEFVPFAIKANLLAEVVEDDFVFDLPCILAVGKNTEHELDWSNNSSCTTLTVPLSTVSQRENILSAEQVSIFPNPGSSEIHIVLKGEGIKRVEMTDVSGRPVKLITIGGVSNFSYNVSDLTDGMYFVKIYTTSGKESMRKWVKL